MDTKKRTARVAGLLYLAVAITGFFSPYVRGRLIIAGDVAATAKNILDSEWLFRLGMVNDLIMAVSWIMLGYVLYTLFEAVNRNQGLLMVSFVLVGGAITCINVLNKLAALLILNSADYFPIFTEGPMQAMLYLDLGKGGNYIAHIFFGLWLLPLGYLVFKSNFIPRILGILLAIAGVGYLIDFFVFFLLPDFELKITQFTFWGEVLLLIWLLIKGIKVQPEKRVTE
ncbi:DUF4386 domain-containing protein [Acetobacterium carbinolicum]|uniref:DUF4386 domain-containing protein n=1 Tax=Acetobacterium carbinolicum TaxID=52690 RepID=UPI0039BF64D8